MTLINWEAHRAKFLELREETGITIKEYCEQHDLSFNTARKHLNMKKMRLRRKLRLPGKVQNSAQKAAPPAQKRAKKG